MEDMIKQTKESLSPLFSPHHTPLAGALRDVFPVILSFVASSEVSRCKRVCKQWKTCMEKAFDHSFKNYLPLMWNCQNGHLQESQRLLQLSPSPPPNIQYDKRTSLWGRLFQSPSKEIIELLLSFNLDPSVDGNKAIIMAAIYGDIDVVQLLLKDPRVDPAADNIKSGLLNVAVGGSLTILQLLLAHEPLDAKHTSLQAAIKNGNILEVVKILLTDYGLDPTDRDNLVVPLAAKKGQLEVIQLFLSDRRIASSAWPTALDYATRFGHSDIVKCLLKDYRINDNDLHKAYLEASDQGHIAIIRLFLADPRLDPAFQKNRAIFNAIWEGHTEVVKLIIDDGRVELNRLSNFRIRHAPLHAAAKYNRPQIVRMLLDAGADVNVVDSNGQKPIDLTTDTQIKEMLQNTTTHS